MAGGGEVIALGAVAGIAAVVAGMPVIGDIAVVGFGLVVIGLVME